MNDREYWLRQAERAADRLAESDAKLTAVVHGVVYGPDPPRRPYFRGARFRNNLLGALLFALLVLAGAALVLRLGE